MGKNKRFLQEVIDEFGRAGYAVLNPWKVLNARDYSVPQNRERLFLMGAKRADDLPSYPEEIGLPITCLDALGDLPDAEQFEQLLFCDEVSSDYLKRATGYSALMRCSSKASWRYGYRRKWDNSRLTSSRRTLHTATSRNRFARTPPGTKEPISRFF